MRGDLAVLFDLDGVIIDSRAHHLSAWHQLAREAGLAHAPDYFTTVFGLRNEPIIRGIAPNIAAARLLELADRKEKLFRAAARHRLALLPGVRALLMLLEEASVPRAIVTSTPRANLDMVVDDLGISDHFRALVAEEDASKGKPDPEGFLVAASRVAVEPGGCIVIEDAPAGLEAAKRGGMRAIGVTTTHAASALGDADLVVGSLADPVLHAFILGDEAAATPP